VIAEAGFLFAVTALNMSLASLAGLVVAFRRSGSWAAYDLYRLRQIVEFGFANALLSLALIPLSAMAGSVASAVTIVAGVAIAYFVVYVLVLTRRWRAVAPGEFPVVVIGLDLVVILLLVATIALDTVAVWEWALLALTARPMIAFLLVLSTLRTEGG